MLNKIHSFPLAHQDWTGLISENF